MKASNILFKGAPITSLSRAELIEALVTAWGEKGKPVLNSLIACNSLFDKYKKDTIKKLNEK